MGSFQPLWERSKWPPCSRIDSQREAVLGGQAFIDSCLMSWVSALARQCPPACLDRGGQRSPAEPPSGSSQVLEEAEDHLPRCAASHPAIRHSASPRSHDR